MEPLETLEDVQIDKEYRFQPLVKDIEELDPKLHALIGCVVSVSSLGDGEVFIYDPEGGSEIEEPVYHYELYPLIQDWDA